jgi:4-hydroxybenzoate polyprenyltransferase
MTASELFREFTLTLFWPAAAALSLAVSACGTSATGLGLALLAGGTMAGYGLDRLIDRRHLDPPFLRRALTLAIGTAALAALALAATAPWRMKVCTLLGVLAGAYVPLKRMIPKNLLTTTAWTIAVMGLPHADAPDFTDRHAAAWIAVALIMFANTTLCDLNSVEDDRRHGVRGLAPKFGATVAACVAGLAACAATASAVMHHHVGLACCAGTLAPLAILLGRNPANRRARFWTDLTLVIIPGPVELIQRSGVLG